MIDFSSINENYIIVTLIVIFDIWLGLWVYFSNRYSKTNQQFFLLTFLLLFWAVLCYLKSILTPDISLILVRLAYGIVALFFIPFYFFLKHFPREEKTDSILDRFILGICFFLFFFSFGNWMVRNIEVIDGRNVPVLGEGRFIYLGVISILLLFITIRFLVKYLKFSKSEKLKAQYFLIGLAIFIFVNSIFNIILPLFQGHARYSCIGNHSAIFLLTFTAYAIVKRQLFGIKVILTDLLVGVIGMILFIFPFFLNTPLSKIAGWSVFGLYSIVGYLLIRYTRQEVKQKEILEEKVKERTKELRKSKEEIERAYEEIKKKKEDLEKFYKLTVGRELRMIELKQKIKELEEKLKKKRFRSF